MHELVLEGVRVRRSLLSESPGDWPVFLSRRRGGQYTEGVSHPREACTTGSSRWRGSGKKKFVGTYKTLKMIEGGV